MCSKLLVREQFIPVLARAFFRLDHPTLAAHCRATAMAQMRAVAAAREAEGLEHDGTILQVSKVELLKAQQMEDAKGGTTPLLLVSAQVQYIHAVRDKTVRGGKRVPPPPPSCPPPKPRLRRRFRAFGMAEPFNIWRHIETPAAGRSCIYFHPAKPGALSFGSPRGGDALRFFL